MALLRTALGRTELCLRTAGLAAALLVSTLVGCSMLERWRSGPETFAFSHRLHVEEQGLGCTDCHNKAEGSEEPGLPVVQACMLCHEDLDAEKPPERRVDSLFRDGKLVPRAGIALREEVRFSHLTHVTRLEDCTLCHGSLATSDDPTRVAAPSMKDCTSCHAERGLREECSTCHTEVGQDWRPQSHGGDWLRFHGPTARHPMSATENDCSMCHSESSCSQCHEVSPPTTHTNAWRLRMHGLEARLDRETCAVCHRSDSCQRCHEQSEPLSHRMGGWGAPRDTHCVSCHFPLSGEGCAVCHRDTASHALATPLPGNHNAGMNCRQCHGLTAPLPHVDKGDLCVSCHR